MWPQVRSRTHVGEPIIGGSVTQNLGRCRHTKDLPFFRAELANNLPSRPSVMEQKVVLGIDTTEAQGCRLTYRNR